METKPRLFNFRIDDEIRDKLQYLADLTQRTQSNYLRWLIDREYKLLADNGKPGEKE